MPYYGPSASDFDINGLTEVDLALDDELAIADTSDSNNNKKVGVERAFGLASRAACQGRLTLTSGTAVTTSDVTAAGTIYFTPFKGNLISLYDGTRWKLFEFTERSLTFSSDLTSGDIKDVFIYDNSGTLTLELSNAWTNDTTRSQSLTKQDGILVKSGAATRRYLGTIRGTGTDTTEDSKTKRFVWNMYNQHPRGLLRNDSTTTWTYSSSTLRAANNSTDNRVEILTGLSRYISLEVTVVYEHTSGGASGIVALDQDGTSAIDSQISTNMNVQVANQRSWMKGRWQGSHIGYHFYQWVEGLTSTANTATWYGQSVVNGEQFVSSGIYGEIIA